MKRETVLLDEALTMIRAWVYRPNVVQGRHWKVSWVNQQSRTRLLVIALFRVIAEREYSHAHCCEGCWRHERFPAGIGGKLAALILVLSPDQDGEVIVTVHAIIRLLLSGVLKAPRSERSLTGDCIDQCCRETARVLAQGATVLDLIARQP